MCLTDEDGKPYNDKWLRDVLFNFLIAGRDTTAITSAWFFYLVSQNPEVEAKLRAEIEEHFPGDRVASQQDVKSLKYLDWCLHETLRLYPAVPAEGRICIKDCVLPTGHRIPAGTFVSISSYLMQRRPDYFPDPLAFKPERWASHPPHPYAFVSFYGGAQVCLGQSLALLEMKTLAVNLLKRFTFRVEDGFLVKPKRQIVLRAAHGIRMTVHAAKDAADIPYKPARYEEI